VKSFEVKTLISTGKRKILGAGGEEFRRQKQL
jgi:hypothetical protein